MASQVLRVRSVFRALVVSHLILAFVVFAEAHILGDVDNARTVGRSGLTQGSFWRQSLLLFQARELYGAGPVALGEGAQVANAPT